MSDVLQVRSGGFCKNNQSYVHVSARNDAFMESRSIVHLYLRLIRYRQMIHNSMGGLTQHRKRSLPNLHQRGDFCASHRKLLPPRSYLVPRHLSPNDVSASNIIYTYRVYIRSAGRHQIMSPANAHAASSQLVRQKRHCTGSMSSKLRYDLVRLGDPPQRRQLWFSDSSM